MRIEPETWEFSFAQPEALDEPLLCWYTRNLPPLHRDSCTFSLSKVFAEDTRILRQNSCAPPCERPSNLHDSHALCGCRALCGAYDLVLANDSKKNQSDRGKA